MRAENVAYAAVKSVAIDIVGDFLYFPIWWYTNGLKKFLLARVKTVSDTADHLALRLLVLNIFKPMFAQYDRAGRIISFFMRVVLLAARSVYFLIYFIIQLAFILIWLGLPVLVLYRLVSIFFVPYGV